MHTWSNDENNDWNSNHAKEQKQLEKKE